MHPLGYFLSLLKPQCPVEFFVKLFFIKKSILKASSTLVYQKFIKKVLNFLKSLIFNKKMSVLQINKNNKQSTYTSYSNNSKQYTVQLKAALYNKKTELNR